MKVLSTDGLTKLIQLIKSAFISVDDTVSTNSVTLATVATTGDYNDLSDKPIIPSAVTESTVSGWGFTKNTGTVTSVNNIQPVNGNVSLSIPTATSDLTNDSGFITGITSSDVTTALGYTPYNSSNPNGYTSNTGTVTSVNNTSPDTNGNVTLSIPEQVQADWNEADSTSKAYIQNKPTIPDTSTLEKISNKVTSISSSSTDAQYPSAKCVYDIVKDQNNTSRILKFWTGTKAQYDAISTKDSNTLYNITDDQDITLTLLQTIYPVGSVYLSTNATCPLASLFGTWTLVSSGKALWTGTGSNGGSTISAGLPNITGRINANSTAGDQFLADAVASATGAMTISSKGGKAGITGGSSTDWGYSWFGIDASQSNSIYGNSSTVQPPAYVVNVWRRTA